MWLAMRLHLHIAVPHDPVRVALVGKSAEDLTLHAAHDLYAYMRTCTRPWMDGCVWVSIGESMVACTCAYEVVLREAAAHATVPVVRLVHLHARTHARMHTSIHIRVSTLTRTRTVACSQTRDAHHAVSRDRIQTCM